MLVVEVRLLTGRFVATSPRDRRASEWPPHPARLYSALVATWAEGDDADGSGRAALEWLETQTPPDVVASDAVERRVLTHYVPVNDTSVVGLSVTERAYAKLTSAQDGLRDATTERERERTAAKVGRARDVSSAVSGVGATNPATAVQLLPTHRVRQARAYPSVTPAVPVVRFVWWDAQPPADIGEALDEMLSRVSRLGHSSSMVACRVVAPSDTTDLAPRWTPDAAGEVILRTTAPGQLRELERAFDRHRGSAPRTMPTDARRYQRVTGEEEHVPEFPDTAGELFVFAHVGGRRLPITAAASLGRAVRAALMRYSDDPPPELISGHPPEGGVSVLPHVGVIALPFVGREHADGHLIGFAIQLPRRSSLLGQRDAVVRAIGRWEGANEREGYRIKVLLEGGEAVRFERVQDPVDAWTLRRQRWARPSRTWVTATPIALGRHPGNLASDDPAAAARAVEEAAATVRAACGHVGLPQPIAVSVTRAPLTTGSRPARAFPPFRGVRGNSPQRLLAHTRVEFQEPVGGPIVLGAGRYVGLGLMLPDQG